jgi:hypothetical protein
MRHAQSCLRIGSAAALAVFAAAPATGQVRGYSEAVLLVRPADYTGTTYAAPPARSAYLFFSGEPIRVQLDIVNRGSQVIELSNAAAVADSFRVTRGEASAFTTESTVFKKAFGVSTPVEPQSPVTLAPGESLVFFSRRDGAPLLPGEHVVEWESGIATASGLRIAPQPSRLQFEVRDSSSETAAEEARRNAIRAFRDGQDTLAAQWVTRLLELNPQSHAAHVLRGDLSLRAGDKAAAAACFDAALRILETHADQEYNRWTPAALTRATIDGLKARLNASR